MDKTYSNEDSGTILDNILYNLKSVKKIMRESNLEKKLSLLNSIGKNLSKETIIEIIVDESNINNTIKLIDIYINNSTDLEYILRKSNIKIEEKIILFNIYQNKFNLNQALKDEIIETLNIYNIIKNENISFEEKKSKILKNAISFGKEDIIEIIINEENVDNKVQLIDIALDLLKAEDFIRIIAFEKDLDKKEILLVKYLLFFFFACRNDFLKMIIEIADSKQYIEEIADFINKLKLFNDDIAYIINNLSDLDVENKIYLTQNLIINNISFSPLIKIAASIENNEQRLQYFNGLGLELELIDYDFVRDMFYSADSIENKYMILSLFKDNISLERYNDLVRSLQNDNDKNKFIILAIDNNDFEGKNILDIFENILFIKKCNIEVIDIKIIEYMSQQLKKVMTKDDRDFDEYFKVVNNVFNFDEYSILALQKFMKNNSFQGNIEELFKSTNLIVKLSMSNSTEIQHLTPNLVGLLMGKDKSEQDKIINELETVFLKNNLPMMAKLYKVFDIMHPNFGEFNGEPYQSPNLNNKNNPLYKQIILFADLMRITAGSNNRSLKEYIKHIEVGNEIAKHLISNDIGVDSLDDNYKEILIDYLKHLETLYNNTLYGKKNPVKLSGNIKIDIENFIKLFGKNEEKFDINKLPDRIVKMFGHFAGIDTMDELKILMDTTINSADDRNRKRAEIGSFEIHKGYFVKGIANQDKEDEFYSFLTNIFQNGSLCKELLGDAARSDSTPMDTDVSRMLEEPASFEDAFNNPKYASSRYGPLWIVLKDDERFNETSNTNNKYIPGKLEVFETSMDRQGHYGIRTGFASSDIDYLVVDESKIRMDRIKYEIVMNGFYIPLLNTKGNLVFTPEEYDELHEKMSGLSYYNTEKEYKFASELDNFDINNTGYNIDIVKSINEVTKVRKEVISKLKETGLDIKLGRSLDLKDECIDLIDTGSTSRGTNKMNGYDFDFVMRVDKDIYTNDDKMNKLYQSFKNVFSDIEFDGHKIRKYKLKLDNGKEVELDITFIMKTNKMDYSTEECLQDRLNTIKNMDEDKYKKTLENIVLAKYVLGSVYKSKNAAENPQGGLGGVGIENWILQNGGSFERAARSFIEKAEGRSFQEFTKVYTIWDFGQNNLSFKRYDGYAHDEFITNNMNEEGYNKMVSVLNEYIYTLEQSKQL